MELAHLKEKLGPDLDVIRSLGEGSVATVVLARELPLKRLVAVKILRPELVRDDITRRRFLREARSAARISHPNVVSVFRVGSCDDGTPYIVMEYVDGRTLEGLLKAEGRLDQDRARTVVVDLARALSAAHAHGIVHRDLRPNNVLIDNSGRLVLSDFGIAGILESGTETITRITQAGQLLGETRYTSPEQLQGERVTAAADVYSLAVTAYEILTLEAPWPDRGPAAMVRSHLQDPPRPLRSLRSNMDAGFATLLERCLAKDPTHRPRAEDIVRQLEAPEPPHDLAYPPDAALPGFQRFLSEIRRRRVGRVGMAYLVFVVAYGTVRDGVLSQYLSDAVDLALLTTIIAFTPVALVLAWMYDWTPEGIRRTAALSPEEGSLRFRGLQAGALILALGLAILLWYGLSFLTPAS